MMKKISKNSFLPLFLFLTSFATQAEQTINHNIANKWPDSRYVVNNDGTVTEIETGLMWQQCSLGQVWTESNGRISCEGDAIEYTWGAAITLAARSNDSGHSDWRLPNVKELNYLVAKNRYAPAINLNVFPGTPSSPVWSSTPYLNYPDSSWMVDFEYGGDRIRVRDNRYLVRLVRDTVY
jgi:hypothetical protein